MVKHEGGMDICPYPPVFLVGAEGLEPRHSPCKGDALPTELSARERARSAFVIGRKRERRCQRGKEGSAVKRENAPEARARRAWRGRGTDIRLPGNEKCENLTMACFLL